MTKRTALFVAAAVLSQSCAGGHTASDDWAYTEHRWSYDAAVTRDLVLVHSGALLTAKADAELIAARPARVDRGIEVVATRLVLRHEAETGVDRGDILGACTDVWPPAGWGQTSKLEGFQVKKGDLIAVQFYVRGTRTGDWATSGIKLEYRADGKARTLSSPPDDQGTARLFVRADPSRYGDHPACLVVPASERIFQPSHPQELRPRGEPAE